MKTITFLMGAGGNDWWEDVDVTDEEYERLRIALSSRRAFYQCEEIRDIYDRIWDIADASARCANTKTLIIHIRRCIQL